MKTSELTGAQLDYWVAKAEGKTDPEIFYDQCLIERHDGYGPDFPYSPSTDWAQGGPIIDREGISVIKFGGTWGALHPGLKCNGGHGDYYIDISDEHSISGENGLIAAMRAYVASKFGDEVPGIDT